MTTCPACQRDIPEERKDCPYCGVVFAKWKSRAKPQNYQQQEGVQTSEHKMIEAFRYRRLAVLLSALASICLGIILFFLIPKVTDPPYLKLNLPLLLVIVVPYLILLFHRCPFCRKTLKTYDEDGYPSYVFNPVNCSKCWARLK